MTSKQVCRRRQTTKADEIRSINKASGADVYETIGQTMLIDSMYTDEPKTKEYQLECDIYANGNNEFRRKWPS